MIATRPRVTPPEYEKWLDQRKADIKAADDWPPHEAARRRVEKQILP